MEEEIIKIKVQFYALITPRGTTNWRGKSFIVTDKKGGNFGVLKWKLCNVLEGQEYIDEYNEKHHDLYNFADFSTIIVNGNYPLQIYKDANYIIHAKKRVDKKYGIVFILTFIQEDIDLSTLDGQKNFLRTFLTPYQIDEFYKVYDNPLAILQSGDAKKLEKIKGVGPYISNSIMKRFKEREGNAAIYTALGEYGIPEGLMHKIIKEYKTPELVINMVKYHPYDLIQDIDGVGFKTADTLALKVGLSPRSVDRLKAYIIYYLTTQAEQEGNSYTIAVELLQSIYDYFEGKDNIVEDVVYDGKTITNVGAAINSLIAEGTIGIEDAPNKGLRKVYLTEYWDLEKQIALNLKRLINAPNDFDYKDWEDKIRSLEKEQGFSFDEDQKRGIKLGLDNQICYVTGAAGTGKSSLVSGILRALSNYSFAQCALSGKAAARLQEVTGEAGSTIHRLLQLNSEYPYNADNPLSFDIIILDEVSLVGGEIFLDLLRAIPTGSKLIMLGDRNQLPAIGALNLAHDFFESDEIPTVELTTIHRQAQKSGIITSAHSVKNGLPIFEPEYEGRQVIGELQDMYLDIAQDNSDTVDRAMAWFKKALASNLVDGDIMKIQVVSPVKERGDSCVYWFNQAIQELVNPVDTNNKIPYGSKDYRAFIKENDKVMCIKNNYHVKNLLNRDAEIFNGWTGIVQTITDSDVLVYFPIIDDVVKINTEDAGEYLTLGYASTVHKLQGSDYPVIIGVLDFYTPPSMLNRQLLYTMLTRAKKKCILVGQAQAINKAIITSTVPYRRTFMQQMLKEL